MSRLLLVAGLCLVGMSADLSAATLQVSVVDEAGKPLQEVRVDVATAAPRIGRGIFCPSCYLDCVKWAKTDQQGRLEIKDLDPTLKFRVLVTALGKQSLQSGLLDPAAGPVEMILRDFPTDVPRTRIIEGVVISPEGLPIEGALVEPNSGEALGAERYRVAAKAQSAVTDHDGHFKMLLEGDYSVIYADVIADGHVPALAVLKPNDAPSQIKMTRGTAVSGQVVNVGAPAAGVPIAVVQIDRTSRSTGSPFIKAVLATTDRDGRFEFHCLPALEEYVVFSPLGAGSQAPYIGPVLTTKKFQVRDNDQSRDLGTLALTAGLTMSGRVKMADGSALPADLKISLGRTPAWDLNEVSAAADGRFEMTGLPAEIYEVRIAGGQVRLATSQLNYQVASRSEFLIRLTASIDNLEIPLLKSDAAVPSADEAAAQAKPAGPAAATFVPPAPGRSRPAVTLGVAPVPADGPKVSVSGVVVTTEGSVVPGAEVWLQPSGYPYSSVLAVNPPSQLAQTTTDEEGRFTFTDIPLPLGFLHPLSELVIGNGRLQVLARSQGRSWTAAMVTSLSQNPPLRLTLQPEVEVRGTVLDASGSPLPNIEVRLEHILEGTEPALFHGSPTEDESFLFSPQFATQTDQAGAFTIPNMPPECLVLLRSRHVAMIVDTHAMPQPVSAQRVFRINNRPVAVQVSPIEIRHAAPIVLNVRVLDHAGTLVTTGAIVTDNEKGTEYVYTRVESDGTTSVPVESAGKYSLNYLCDTMSPELTAGMVFNVLAGQAAVPCDLYLPEKHWLSGRVVDMDSGAGIVGARLRYHSEVYRADRRVYPSGSFAISQSDGAFRIPVHSGFGSISVGALFGFDAARATTRLEIREGEDILPVTVKVCRGLVLRGIVVDEQGKPVSGAEVRAQSLESVERNIMQSDPMGFALSDQHGQFEIGGLSLLPRTSVIATGLGLGDAIELPGEPRTSDYKTRVADVRLVLKPGVQVAGRVMRNGKPQSGVQMTLKRRFRGTQRLLSYATVVTDPQGRYLFGGLVPNDRYLITIRSDDGAVASGWPYQRPSGREIPEGATGVMELRDANLLHLGQSLAGIVVDPEGRPLSGFQISPTLQNRGGRIEGVRDVVTDASGRFVLQQLPNEQISLLVRQKPERRQRSLGYMTRIPAGDNQRDLRIVMDPSLVTEIESLDPKE